MKVVVYTDGACKGNPGPGGWGAVLFWGDAKRELYGGEADTTNNRMEMTAAIIALETLTRRCDVVLHTDSDYVKTGITEWLPKWRKQTVLGGGKTLVRKKNKPVKNADLWMRLEAAAARHEVEWKWVRGHAGDAGNEHADRLANLGATEAARR
ncbi:MAG: ribonuclease HI [Gammaproteobacteria bacterium]